MDAVATPLSLIDRSKRFLRRVGFLLLNVWIVFHLVAVFAPGFSVPPSPRFARQLYQWTSGYVQALFMDHGYHFFGPDPGSATLIGYMAQNSTGEQFRGFYPHKGIFPRLMYHRHFMLTEAIPGLAMNPATYQLAAQTYAARVRKEFEADKVELTRITHELISTDRYYAGVRITDPETYREESLGEFRWPGSHSSRKH